MYSGETTVTNDQLEGVLKAGDILRVRGLWRSNSGSKKENIQSNNQKVNRDKREQPPLTGQLQKIKLVQPTSEKISEPLQQAESSSTIQNSVSTGLKTYEKKSSVKNLSDKEDKSDELPDGKKSLDEGKSNEPTKNKENVEANGKKRKNTSSDADSTKSKSEAGDSVRTLFFIRNDDTRLD
jgi:hypothetical protein